MAHTELIIIDNYDSFTYNLVQLFSTFGIKIQVFRNDRIGIDDIPDNSYICISPGPKSPRDAGISKAVIERFYTKVPILGVCLGMQAINEVFGGKTQRAPIPVHGKRCTVTHNNESIFKGIPSPFKAARYHSLCCSPVACPLKVLATGPDGVVMAIRHPLYPLFGVQFHPESFLSEYGEVIIRNFLSYA